MSTSKLLSGVTQRPPHDKENVGPKTGYHYAHYGYQKQQPYEHYFPGYPRMHHPSDNSLDAAKLEQHRSFGQELTNMGGVGAGAEPPNKPFSSQAMRVKLNTTRLHLDGVQHPLPKSSRNQSREGGINTSLNTYLYSRAPATRKNLHAAKPGGGLTNVSSALSSSRAHETGSANRAHSASSMSKKARAPSASLQQPHVANQTGFVPCSQPAMAPPPSLGGPRRPSFRKLDSLAARNRMAFTGHNTSRSGSEQRSGALSLRTRSVSSSDIKAKQRKLGEFYEKLEMQRERDLLPCDFKDRRNPQLCGQYAFEITEYISTIENRFLPEPGYIRKQTDINERMRGILIDWLVDVHLKFKLLPETLYLTVNMIDRFLDKEVISRRRLQLVGIAAMLISSKYEEIYPPEIKDFTYITDRAYSKQDVLDMEGSILDALNFNITVPSCYRFLERFARLSNLEIAHHLNMTENGLGSTGLRTFLFARYLTELALVDYQFLKYTPREVAAAAIYLALRLMKFLPPWNENLKEASGLGEGELKACARDLMNLLEQSEKSNLKAVRKKYSQKKFMEVAKIKLDLGGAGASPP